MRARVAWWSYAAAAGALALVVLWNWIWAVTLRGPVLYGEGAVAHAAILARDGLEYTSGARYGDVSPIFTAANYPPLYFHLAGIGDDPFVTGRILSIAATLLVAGAIAWRARPGGWLVAGALALAWLGSVPVMQWGLAVKPDLLVLALTVCATLALARARPLPLIAGVLIGVAVMAKPTALLPGLALLAYVAWRSPLGATRGLVGGLVSAIAVTLFTSTSLDSRFIVHVIDWNALPWRAELAAPLVLIALFVLAVPVATVVVTRAGGGAVGAYAVGAIGVLLLGGREGATVNYLLDLSAALALAAATIAPRLSLHAGYPVASIAQLALGVVLLNPFPATPSLLAPTAKWGDHSALAFVRDVPGTVLVEDSGLLVANGREPLVDDLFLWSRNYASGKSFLEGPGLLQGVRAGQFDAIVSEVELERIELGPGYERQRWHPDLVAAVLERYRRPTPEGARPGEIVVFFNHCPAFVWCRQLYVYTRR